MVRGWGYAQGLGQEDAPSGIISPVFKPCKLSKKAEYWGVILALKALMPVHQGIGKKSVCVGTCKLLSGGTETPLLPLLGWKPISIHLHCAHLKLCATVKVGRVKRTCH